MRKMLPDRRRGTTIKFSHAAHSFIATVGFYPDGTVGELFVNTEMKSGSESDVNASDAAIAISFALQYGCPLEVLRAAMKRNPDGSPMGPLGHALDLASEIPPGG